MKFKVTFATLAAFSLAGAGLLPANAVATTLPEGANPGDTSEIQTVVCPNKVQMWLPMPLNDNPIASTDYRYADFSWIVMEQNDNVMASDSRSASINQGFPGMAWTPGSSLSPGDTYTLTLVGQGTGEDAVEFDVNLTVADDNFSGSGAGTPADPYLVSTASELDEMRCIEDAYWKLTDDIDLSGFNGGKWTPFTLTSNYDWSGVIDGNGKTISGANIGHPQQPHVGLLGSVVSTSVANLTLEDFDVHGSYYTGALASVAEYGTAFDSISILNTTVTSSGGTAGMMFGGCDNGCAIKNSEVRGTLNARQSAYDDGGRITVKATSIIGGIAGRWGGSNGGYLTDSVIDVDISIRPEANYLEIAADRSREFWTDNGGIAKVAGVFGESDEDFVAVANKVTANVSVEGFGRIYQISGYVGQNDFPSTLLDLESDISIVTLGSNQTISEIGGAVGQSDDIAISKSRIVSTISVADGDGSNNYFGIDAPSGEYDLDELGGVYGEYDDDTADFMNEVQLQIDIVGAELASYVGGYAGGYDDDNGLNVIEVVASGRINIESTRAERVGGFVGAIRSNGAMAGNSALSAVEIEIDADSSTEIGPVVGYINQVDRVIPLNFYWDTDVNSYSNQSGYNFLPATTLQLQNLSFLSEAGFDMTNSWVLNDGYPELSPTVYAPTAGSADEQPIQIGDTLVYVKGNRDFTTAGGLLELEGEGLRGVALSVNGQPLFVQIITDTSGFVQIPAGLPVGSYTLVATANSGNQSLQDAFRILGDGSNSDMKVWTKRIAGETQAKFYAKNIVGEGKVRFVLNGTEIAWVNALDNTDPKLRSANGAYYLVRTANLKVGKNVLEIYVDGIRERRVVYTR